MNELTKFLQCHDDFDESSFNAQTDAIRIAVVRRPLTAAEAFDLAPH